MKMKYKDLVAHVNEIAHLIDSITEAAQVDICGKCLSNTKITYSELKKREIPCRVAGGRAAFSFNLGRFGIIDYGYDEKPALGGKKIGHFWIISGDYLIDTTLRHLKSEAIQDDVMRSLPPSEFLLDDRMVLRRKDISTYKQLYDGKLGWHYLEIPGRGEQAWTGHPDLLESKKAEI